MSTPSATHGIVPDGDDTNHHDADQKPHLRRRHSSSAEYLESSTQNHKESSQLKGIRELGRSDKMSQYDKRRNQRMSSSNLNTSNAHARRKRLLQELSNDAGHPAEKSSELILKTTAEQRTIKESAEVKVVPLPKYVVKGTSEQAQGELGPGITAGQRTTSAPTTVTVMHHDAKEIISPNDFDLSSQDQTGHEEGPSLQRRHTTVVPMSRKMNASQFRPKRPATEEFQQVHGSAHNLGREPKPSARIQRIMAKLDHDIKARVQADVEQRRLQRQGESFGQHSVSKKPENWTPGPNKPATQAQRHNSIERNQALPKNVAEVVNDEALLVDEDTGLVGESSAGLEAVNDQERDLDQETPMEDETSAEADPFIGSLYEVESVVSAHAVAAHMVNAGEARVVKITPRTASIRHSRQQYGAFRRALVGRPSRTNSTRSLNGTQVDTPLVEGHEHDETLPRHDLNKREIQLAQSLQPKNSFVFRENKSRRLPEQAGLSRARSPFKRPAAPLSYHSDKEEDDMSSVSVDNAGDIERSASPPPSLFSMPNRQFLFHADQDDECPSLMTDDDQDRRVEEARLGGLDLDPSLPSTPQHWEPGHDSSRDLLREATGWMGYTKTSAVVTGVEDPRRLAHIGPRVNGTSPDAMTRGENERFSFEIGAHEFAATVDNRNDGKNWHD